MADVYINPNLCENHQLCIEVCPEGVFEIERGRVVVKKPDECTICYLCVENCPSGAITVE